jgi:SPP1 family predicted phage head-tail adaptor
MSLAIQMDQRITLQVPPTGRNALNEPTGDWTNFVTDGDGMIWAGVNDLSGHEFAAAGGTQNAVQTQITIRFREGVVAKMRVLHGADIYNIEAVLSKDRRTQLLMCSRGVANG